MKCDRCGITIKRKEGKACCPITRTKFVCRSCFNELSLDNVKRIKRGIEITSDLKLLNELNQRGVKNVV